MADIIRFSDRNEEYEPTDSEDELSEDERELLEEVKNRNQREVNDKHQELMRFDDSDDEDEDADHDDDDDDDDDNKDLINDSDIEGAENDDEIPDAKDWGSKSRNYYNTDFVDQDYSTYNEQEEEMAKQEEEEAKIIQMRLAKQMKEEDFQLDDILGNTDNLDDDNLDKEKSHLNDITKLKADFSGLTKRERQRLFEKDSPEFAGLINDFNQYLEEINTLVKPVLDYVHKNNVPMIPALQFAQLYQNIALTYSSNIIFYLLLKARRANVRSHPITKRLVQLKKLLKQLQDKHENIIRPQLEALLERIQDGDKFEVRDTRKVQKTVSKETKLSILDQYERDEQSEDDNENKAYQLLTADSDIDEDQEDENMLDNEEQEEGGDTRRGITYQIAKNKGLKVHRKKEQRNPRVKHRSKFRKAIIRRKGAVRTVRKELTRYGGEISGIKATVSKSIKFKS